MRKNIQDTDWLNSELNKVDRSGGYAIIENPDTKTYLDNLLITKYWPMIHQHLEETQYNYGPIEKPETEFELRPVHARSLIFMLFDGMKSFFRGKLECALDSWMIESKFFLGLTRDNNPNVIFEILGNTRFEGLPPELTVYKNADDFFQITFHHGSGRDWWSGSDQEIENRIIEIIDVNIQLYEFSQDGYISEEMIGDFLTLAYKVYEAY